MKGFLLLRSRVGLRSYGGAIANIPPPPIQIILYQNVCLKSACELLVEMDIRTFI